MHVQNLIFKVSPRVSVGPRSREDGSTALSLAAQKGHAEAGRRVMGRRVGEFQVICWGFIRW